jgi:hypothetical protein
VNGKLALLSIVAATVALILAGCGGGGPDPLSKQAFIKQGNAICLEATKKREAAMADAAKQGGVKTAAASEIVALAIPPTEEMVDGLDGLGIPEGDEKQVEAMIAEFEEGIEKLESQPDNAPGGSEFGKADESALAYGLTECVI